MPHGSKPQWTRTTIPPILKGVTCPTCKREIKAIYVKQRRHLLLVGQEETESKILVPCYHQITPQEEQALIRDVLKKGL